MSQLESRVFRRAAHGKFVHVGLAQSDVISCHQFIDDRRIVRRFEIFQHLRSTRSLLAFYADVILNGTGDTGKVTDRFASCDFSIDSGSRFQGIFAVIRQECLYFRFYCIFMCKKSLGQFDSRYVAVDQFFMQFMDC